VADIVYNDELFLITLEQIKTILGITGTEHDAALTAAAPVVTDLFENYCRRGLAHGVDIVEEMEVGPRLSVFRFPLEVVTELLIDDVAVEVPKLDRRNGHILLGYRNSSTRATITYTGGFPQTDVPIDLATAYANCCKDYSGIAVAGGTTGGGGGSTPLKSLSLGSGALAVAFDTSGVTSSAYDVEDAPTILQPYAFTLRRFFSPYA
jgi:hypothetical protein